MLPEHLIAEYWIEVENLLQSQFQLTPAEAQKGIADYRARLDRRRVGEIVYHREPADLAGTIAGLIQRGGFHESESVVA